MQKIDRRRFIKNSTAITAAGLLIPYALAQTTNPPNGQFDSDSTAEEVTAGIDLSGKTVVVTGANSGLGLETMRVLALRGAHVIGTARNAEKAKAACDSVAGKTTPVVLELGDFNSIAACTDTINALGTPIDILVCNAGIMEVPELQLVNGVEKQFAINHLGHYLFTRRLLDQVKASKQGRVVMVSSLGYKWAPEGGIQFDNLDGSKGYDPKTAYGQSKLANALLALELSNQFEGSNATANAIHPGIINTNLGRNFPAWKQTLGTLIGWAFMKTIPEGAATSCYVATNPALAKVSGHYFENCNPVVPDSTYMRDHALAKQLWNVSEQLTQKYLA